MNAIPMDELAIACQELQALQRQRAVVLKSRNMQANRIQAVVAGTLGYHSGMKETDRKKKFKEAIDLIKDVLAGERNHAMEGIIRVTYLGIDAFNDMKARLEKSMETFAAALPVASWVKAKEQRGFGFPMLGVVIGETGDLRNYPNPAKVWRRLGCAPWSFNGKTLMGSSWKMKCHPSLPAAEWEAFGYSPRRRSIAFNVGDPLIKLNKGPYRKRYEETKALLKQQHPDYSDMRCHKHGMLLATKLLLKNLWIEWNNHPAMRGL